MHEWAFRGRSIVLAPCESVMQREIQREKENYAQRQQAAGLGQVRPRAKIDNV